MRSIFRTLLDGRPATTALAAALATALLTTAPATAQEYRTPDDVTIDSVFHGLNARAIGPAGTSGRIAAIAVSPRDERIWMVGAATGGLWKTADFGFTWEAAIDHLPVNSVGAVAFAPSAPHTVYVGTGEANARNSMGVGRGVWKSIDEGRSWTYLGLAETERIEAILVHPTNPDVVWLTALGPAWSDGEERGVYRSTDGGESWEKVLFVDERTGAFELVMDPANPEHLLASTWTYRRWPWFFESGGEGSGLWSTWDGGDTWRKLGPEDGLPEGELGRIGLAFAQNDPDVAYALVEAETSALLRSEDGGTSWETVNDEPGVNERAFYYSRIYVDPTNENRVYRVSGDLSRSDDGGRTFEVIAPWSSVHVDHHAFYASPDGHTIVSGNDGGVFVSNDRGGSWRFVENLPLAQFYHLSVDMETPFNVLGGLQDNGSWRGPSQAWEQPSFAGSNITNEHWRTIGFGDGFAALIDPTDPTLGYSMSQGGNLQRFDLVTGQWAGIRPPAPDADTELRFNWNAGIALDPFDPSTIYYGSQFVHMSPNRGEDWEIISPDLTTDDPGKQRQEESGGLTLDVTAAENHTSILTIAPSSLERGVIWVGTDDGNVQITRDGGASWTNVIENVPGVPANTWIPHIEASKHDPATAYVVFDDHRRGNWETYVFRTTDYGESFQPLSPGQIDGYVHVIEEDPGEPNLLFLGTEFGMYVSLDRGANWRKFTHGDYPAGAPTRAIVVHPRDHDLAIGTHGRGAWIVDDIRPLREMAAEPTLADADLHLFSPPPAISHTVGLSGPFYFPGDTRFQGENRPYGALISYLVGDELADEFADEPGARPAPPVAGGGNPFGPQAAGGGEGPTTIEILQADTVVRTLKGPSMAGMNRIVWGLERKGLPDPDADAEDAQASGPEVLPGSYDVRITLGEATSEGSLTVLPDPRRERDTRIAAAAVELLFDGQARQQDLQRAIRRLNRTNEVLAAMETRLEDADLDPVVIDSLTAHTDRVQERSGALLDSLRTAPTGEIIADNSITARLGRALGEATGTPYMPSEGRRAQLEWAMEDAGRILREIDAFYTGQLEAYGEALEAAGFDPLDPGGS